MSAPEIYYPLTGGGGGGVSGTGTPNRIPIWNGATSLSDSPLSFIASTLTFSSAVTTQAFGAPQSLTIPANAYGFAINNQLVLDTGSGYLGVNPPTTPASPLHVEGTVGSSSEMVRLRNQLAGINSHVTIQTHANALGGSSPTGKIQNYTTALTPGYGVYNWVYSLSNPNGVMTEVFRQTAPTTILTVTLTSGGSGYANGSYSQAALTNVSSSGSGATADIVVAGGIVTVAVLRSGGSTYQVGDTLTCASIGGGTGFVLTVASVGSSSAATANVTAPRVGAGSATPRASLDVRNGALIDGFGQFTHVSGTGNPIFVGVPIALQVSNQSAALNTLTLGANNFGSRAVNVAYRVDTTAQTASSFNYGVSALCTLAEAGAATATSIGGNFTGNVNTTGLTGRTLQLSGVSGVTSIQAAGGTNTFTAVRAVEALSLMSAAVAQNVTLINAFGTSALSIGGAAHAVTTAVGFDLGAFAISAAATVTNFHGLRLAAPTLADGATITNRFGISQEDTLATNQFSATTNTFSGVVRATSTLATAPAFSEPTDTNTGMYFPFADTIRFAVGGSPAVSITSTKVLQFDSGFGSVANAYGCRAWVNFNGTGVIAIRASGNVSSITDAAVGQYVVNFTSAMPDINYSAIGTKQNVSTNTDVSFYDCINAVASVPARTVNASGWQCIEGAGYLDSANINVAYFR